MTSVPGARHETCVGGYKAAFNHERGHRMSLLSEIEAIKNELREAHASLGAEPGTPSAPQFRIELDGLWKAIEAIAAGIDEDKAQLGF